MVQKKFKVAEVQVSYKPDFKASERPKISSSKQAYGLLMQHWNLGKIEFLEQSKMIMLNRQIEFLD
jgi:DNA repair protein RadC